MAKKKQVKSKYTDIPVKNIVNGAIILDNNMKVTGVKIMPRNIFIQDQATQSAIIANLKTVYNVIDYEFWVIAADRPVDINVYLSELQLLYNKVTETTKRKLIMEDINKANMFTNNNVVDTEYFILFKDKADENLAKENADVVVESESERENVDEVKSIENEMKEVKEDITTDKTGEAELELNF